MGTGLQRLLLPISVAVLLLFVVFVINQTAQVVQLASTIGPGWGQATLILLLALYASLILVPTIAMARLPAALRPPEDEDSPEQAAYLQQLGQRLAANPHLAGAELALDQAEGVQEALQILNKKARGVIKDSARTVFVTTAISQSGRLDAIMVLVAQSRMIWNISRIYHQRPRPRELLRLYTNVAATTFLVREIGDLDISEQVEPIVASALSGSLAGVVPGVSIAATMITHSILEGTANAFLTLRVGIITQRYCASLSRFDRAATRRLASAEAASLLGITVLESAGMVTRAIAQATRKAGVDTMEAVVGGVSRMPRDMASRLGRRPRTPPTGDPLDSETPG